MKPSERVARQLCQEKGLDPDEVVYVPQPSTPDGIILDVAIDHHQPRWCGFIGEAVEVLQGRAPAPAQPPGAPIPFCRDCGEHVLLTAFAGGEEFACSSCGGGNWYMDNAPRR